MRKKGVGYGMLYILYVSLLASILIALLLLFKAPKYVDPFISSAWRGVPSPITWRPDGLEINNNKPMVLNIAGEFPIKIDTSIKNMQPQDLDQYEVYVSKTHLYATERGNNSFKVVPITAKDDKSDTNSITLNIVDTGEEFPDVSIFTEKSNSEVSKHLLEPAKIKKFVQTGWTFISIFIAGIFLFIVFIWKLTVAFIYSIVALIINALLKRKAPFEALFAASVASMTPVIMLQALSPFFAPLIFLLKLKYSIIITVIYLFVTINSWSGDKKNPLPDSSRQGDFDPVI